MSIKLKSFVVLLGLSIGLTCLLQSTVVYGGESSENKYQIMAGEWEVKTIGTKAGVGKTIEKLSQTIILTFASEKQKKLEITGTPFGFTLGDSKLKSAKKGGIVKFDMSYTITGASLNSDDIASGDFQVVKGDFNCIGSGDIVGTGSNFSCMGGQGMGGMGSGTGTSAGGGNYGISWKGKLNGDGTKITNGEFSMTSGSGTFTAVKMGTEKAEKADKDEAKK